MMMVVFSIVRSETQSGREPGDFPYPVFSFAGLLPWTFFATAISSAGQYGVVGSERPDHEDLFSEAGDSVCVGRAPRLVRFSDCLCRLIGNDGWPGTESRPNSSLPSWCRCCSSLVALTLAAIGVRTLLAALNVAYRDIRYVIPFLTTLWLFATPTVYIDTSSRPVAATESSADTANDNRPPSHQAGGTTARNGARTH